MRRRSRTVRVSSKGQIVIPADVRRELGIQSGRVLRLRREGRTIVLSLEDEKKAAAAMLAAAREWAKTLDYDPLEAFHEERRRERARLGLKE